MSAPDEHMNDLIRAETGRPSAEEAEPIDDGPTSEDDLFPWEDHNTLMNALIRRAAGRA